MKHLIICSILCVSALFLLSGCSSKTPDNLGLKNGQFASCPESNNCVSSQATDKAHTIAPIDVAHNTPDVVMVNLTNSIQTMFGGKVIKIDGNYLHAEFTSRVMRFVDDMECFYDEPAGVIQIRSASRVGYSDFDANRKRVEVLREIFAKTQ